MGVTELLKIPMYQVDAFTAKVFSGNPAAVCLLDAPMDEAVMQAIAAENNLAETAFVRIDLKPFELRWFTPTTEVALCGHATLAAAHVLFSEGIAQNDSIDFQSLQSGILSVSRAESNSYTLDFPADQLEPYALSSHLIEVVGAPVLDGQKGVSDLILRLDSAESVRLASPDLQRIQTMPFRGVILTAKGEGEIDFVSRFFGPAVGVDEDPVTGSAHTSLAVYWSKRLGKTKMTAYQASQRGGTLLCELKEDRVLLSGDACLYLKGEIYVPHH